MAKTIGTILSLTDKISPKLITIGRNFDSLDKKQQAMAKSAAYQLNSYAKSLGSAATAAAKFAAASAVALGGAAIKTGLTEAIGLETYRTQLITATKDTERAAEVMRYAISLANKTPFEGADMTSAAAVLEMAGMQTEKYLTLLGDVAAAANRQISDVQGGFVRAFSLGDYSALREATGMLLNAETVATFGRERGITDQAEALYVMLQEKFGGGMEALAQTTKGAWSTITGATKNALANIIGATNEGTVRSGSMLDKLKSKASELADTLVRWQGDGTIDALSEKAASGFDKVWTKAEGLFKFMSKYKEIILGIGTATIAIGALSKGIAALNTILTATKALSLFVSGALSISPVGILAGIAGLASVAVLSGSTANNGRGASINDDVNPIYAADQFNAAADAFERLKNSADLLTGTFNLLEGIGYGLAGVGISIMDFLQDIFDRSAEILRNTLTNQDFGGGIWSLEPTREELARRYEKWIKETGTGNTPNEPNRSNRPNDIVKRYAAAYSFGTHFHSGGRALVGEDGPELVDLPVGSRVYSNQKTRQIFNRGGNTISLSFIVNGINDPDRIADTVCEKILEVLDNV